MSAVLQAAGVNVHYGTIPALVDVDIALRAGRVTGVIGPNGAGKTTLIDALMGFVPLSSGRVCLGGADLDGIAPHRRVAMGLTRTFQGVELFDDMSVEENVAVAVASGRTRPVIATGHQPLNITRLPSTVAGELSPSERKLLALSRALATGPRVLLLDEPAAGLDVDERKRLSDTIREIAASGIAVMLVDHDLALVMDACDDVVVLDLGRVAAVGTPVDIRDDPRVSTLYLGQVERRRTGTAPRSAFSGNVVQVDDLNVSYDGRPAVRGVSVEVRSGELVTLLGPNGAGKTTTLLALSGALSEVTGRGTVAGLPLGTSAHRLADRGLANVLQSGKIFGSLTTAENLRLAAASRESIGRALDLFPTLRPLLDRPAGALSGGEQQTLAIARAISRQPRLLFVDELSLGLAPAAVTQLFDVLARLSRESGVAVLFAEQHVGRALSIADRAYVLAAGRIVLEGSAEQLAAQPERLRNAYLGGDTQT